MVGELYEVYRLPLLRYCIVMCGNQAMAEDIVHMAFMRAMTHLTDLEKLNPAQCRSWLYKTARNLFYDHVRRVSLGAEKEQAVIDKTEDSGFEEAEIYMLLSRLPNELGTLFYQRYFEGYTSTELGEMYGLPPATIRWKLTNARKTLKQYFEEDKI